MKKILVVAVFLLPAFVWAQDAAKWAKARDYLSCRLALEAIRSKVGGDTGIRRSFARVEPVLTAATIEAPLSPSALDGTLREFAKVRQVVVEPLSRIDVRAFAGGPDGARRLVDTAFAVVGRGYEIGPAAKAAMEGVVVKYLAAASGTASAAAPAARVQDTVARTSGAVQKPVIALGGQPDGQAASQRRGFDLWVLLPLLLLGVLCVVIWRKYQEIKEELRTRKVEMRSFNDNYFKKGGGASGGGSAGGSGPDRKAMERAIADSHVIAELNQAIGKLQLRISQLEGKPVGLGSAGATGSGAAAPVPAMATKEKTRPKVVEMAKPMDGADVFYMAGPVNNYFPNSAKSFTKDNTVYRFKVSANKQDAEFELHTSGAPINEIVQLAESYIKSACDEENLPSYPVKNIITKKAGQAILEGDKWIIKSKALIRYE